MEPVINALTRFRWRLGAARVPRVRDHLDLLSAEVTTPLVYDPRTPGGVPLQGQACLDVDEMSPMWWATTPASRRCSSEEVEVIDALDVLRGLLVRHRSCFPVVRCDRAES